LSPVALLIQEQIKNQIKEITNMFAATYFSLVEAGNSADAFTIVQRAKACLEEKLRGTARGGSYEFDTKSTVANFTVCSADAEAIVSLPLSIGSPMGHFGQFERSDGEPFRLIQFAVTADENGEFVVETHQVGYSFARFCQTWKVALRQRLVRECGARLALYVKAQGIDAKVVPDESRLAIFVEAAAKSQFACLPQNFNAVFQRS